MENNNQLPSIPSNYVTLSQLQERWLKEKQEMKLKEEEKELHQSENQQLRYPHTQPNIDAPKPKQGSENRRSDNWKYRGKNRNFKQSFSGASPKEAFVGGLAVVEGNESGSTGPETKSKSTGTETKSKDLGDNMMNEERKEKSKKKKKKRKNKKNKQEDEEKMMKGGETGTQGEEEVVVREVHVPPAKSEKKSIPVRRYATKRDIRLHFRPTNASLVEKSDCAVKLEGEVKDVMEKSEDTVEMERKIWDLCIEEGSDRSETQNNTFNRRNSEYRNHDRIVDNSYSKHRGYRGYNGVFNRRSTQDRVSNGGGYRRNGHFRGSYERFNHSVGNEMVWVKKGEVAVGSDDA